MGNIFIEEDKDKIIRRLDVSQFKTNVGQNKCFENAGALSCANKNICQQI